MSMMKIKVFLCRNFTFCGLKNKDS